MKRILIVFVAFVCFVSSSAAESWRVFDNAALFTAEEVKAIEYVIWNFQQKTNLDFAILTTDDYIGEENQKAIADSFYDSEDIGFGQQASGMLYYLDMNQRIPYISTCGKMVDILADDTLVTVHESAYPSLETAQYKDAVIEIITSVLEAVFAFSEK